MTDSTQQARASSLDQIRARLEAATPGPWVDRVDDLTDEVDVVHDQERVSFVASCGDKRQPRACADAEFIANAPTDIARLLTALEAVIAECGATDTDSDEALQWDLVNRIDRAIQWGMEGR